MSAIPDIVQITITSEASKVSQAGFGLPLILSSTAAWVERVREYDSLAAVQADFATSTPEYKQASKVFGQTPRPPKLLIGRAALKPTQRYAITPVVQNNYTYKVKVNGTEVSYLSDGTATLNEIILGLKAAIDALALPITTTDQTTFLRALANVTGAFFSISASDPNVGLAQDHADPGVATDLAAIALERNDWYGLLTHFNSKAYVEAAAAWVEANKKLYVVASCDSAMRNTSSSGTDDLGEALKALSYKKTAVIDCAGTEDFPDAAAVGRCFPINPGEETWKFKTLAGAPVFSYTATQRSNLRAKNVNFYETTAGVNMLEEGYSASGDYIDFVRYLDFLEARIGERVFGKLSTPNKVPYTDKGIAVVASEISGQLQSDETREALAPGWTVTVPKAANAAPADKASRTLRDVAFSATYAGAIHKVIISGSVVV
ncbi:MAG: DUF3383 family protein [Phycisphaerales bacterium]|nr:DUF3383 family protein [Chloroflexota bacterium]